MTEDRVDRIREQWGRERPDLDTAPMELIGRLHRLAARLRDELVVVYRRHGLGEGEFDVLAALRRAGEPYALAPGELARHTMVTTGAMSKRLDRLEQGGLVQRAVSASDGRGRTVALTGAGRRVIDAAMTEHLANEHRLVAGLDPATRAALVGALRAWDASLSGPASVPGPRRPARPPAS